MSDTKKSGGWLDKVVHTFVEDETPPGEKKAAPVVQAPLPPTTQVVSSPAYTPNQTYQAPQAPQQVPAYSFASATPQIDDAALNVVKSAVYTNLSGRPSRFLGFLKMWETLGKGDPNQALRAMQVSDPSLSPQAIVDDITAHLALLDQVCANAESEFAQAAQSMLGGADAQIQQLQQANAAAQQEIERHQRETADRQKQIADLGATRAENESKIGRAKTNTLAAEDFVRGELQQMQNLFSKVN